MSRRSVPWVLSVVALAAATGYAWQRADVVREIEASRENALQRRSAAETELSGLEKNLAEAEAKGATLRAEAEKVAPQPVAAAAAPAPRATPALPGFAERLRTEPETQALWLKSRRFELGAKYGAFLRQEKLSAEQRTRFEAIALQRDEKEMDLQAVASSQKLSPQDPVLQNLRNEAQREYDAGVRELLGDEGAARLKDYDRTTWVREMVDGIAGGAVVVAREPLTAAQGEQLIQILADASEAFRRGGTARSSDLDWTQIDARAKAVLTPSQFAYFATMEPPLPLGARYQAQLYQQVDEANRRDKTGGAASPP